MKKFLWKDKSGRGISSILTDKDLLRMEDEEDWNSKSLHEFVEDSETGDVWEDHANEYYCLGEIK